MTGGVMNDGHVYDTYFVMSIWRLVVPVALALLHGGWTLARRRR
jgi:hypothetical protein